MKSVNSHDRTGRKPFSLRDALCPFKKKQNRHCRGSIGGQWHIKEPGAPRVHPVTSSLRGFAMKFVP
jgi:hypothetical protein